MNNAIIIKIIEEIRIRTGIGQYMILEEYCSYILSRERDLTEFTIPGSSVTIDKNELLYNMKKALRYNTDKDYDSLLVNTLLYYVSKGWPVMALMNNDEAVLILGFENQKSVEILEPRIGSVHGLGMAEAEEWFKQNGNHFITYIPYEK